MFCAIESTTSVKRKRVWGERHHHFIRFAVHSSFMLLFKMILERAKPLLIEIILWLENESVPKWRFEKHPRFAGRLERSTMKYCSL